MKHTSLSQKKRLVSLAIIILFGALLSYSYFQKNGKPMQSAVHTIAIAPVTTDDHIQGNPDAKVTIVEYSDFECPSCIYFQPTIRQILQTYGDTIRWVTRLYPLPQHVNAEKEAEAAECVASLGGNDAFWKFSDKIFSQMKITEDGTGFPLNQLTSTARTVGVVPSKLQSCLSAGKFAAKIQATITNANNANIQQFPSTIIISPTGNMQLVVSNQPFAVYQQIIDQDLKE